MELNINFVFEDTGDRHTVVATLEDGTEFTAVIPYRDDTPIESTRMLMLMNRVAAELFT